MSRKIPIIKIHGYLLVSIQIELSDNLVGELKEDVCAEIQNTQTKGLIIEVSGVDILDSYIARSIRDISHMATLMGVKSAIAGLDPSMAITLVEMGMSLTGIHTTLNLENAFKVLDEENKDEADISLFDVDVDTDLDGDWKELFE